jgi:hypothetical protein
VSDNFGVGLGDELVALIFELALQLDVILDDSVVDDDDISRAVAMRVGVFFGWAAMGGPARMADAVDAVDGIGADGFFKVAELARGATDRKLAAAVEASRSRLLQTPQAVESDPMYPTMPFR